MLTTAPAILYAASNGRDVFAEVPEGTRLVVDAEMRSTFQGTNWVAVALPRHLSVWVHGELAPEGKASVNNTHVRAGAGVRFRSLGVVEKGAELEVRDRLGEWLRVAPPDSARAWVNAALLKTPPQVVASGEELPQTEIVALPEALAGVLLSETRTQGRATELTGVADWPGVQQWNIPATATLQVGEEIYLLVTGAAANDYIGARVTARGTLWWLAAQDVPLMVVEELTVHPFSLVGE